MKKIGILTHFNVLNFGANLQALSTFSYLKNNGFQPIFINWNKYYEKNIYYKEQIMQLDKFIQHFLKISSSCRNDKEIRDVINNENIEGLLVGSDAILKYKNFFRRFSFSNFSIKYVSPPLDYTYPNPFWLSFLTQNMIIPSVLMSASSQDSSFFGISNLTKKNMRYSLERFAYISARDSWTQKNIFTITHKKVPITPDPVFAFNQNFPQKIIKNHILEKFKLPCNYFALGFRDIPENKMPFFREWIKKIENIAHQNGYSCVQLPFPDDNIELPIKNKIPLPISPLDWYNLIRYSCGFIGNNMHPVVIAIHNAIPFYSFDHYGVNKFRLFKDMRSSKIFDLVNRFKLNHLWTPAAKMHKIQPQSIIYNLVNYDRCYFFQISQQLLKEYNEMMKNISKVLAHCENIGTS